MNEYLTVDPRTTLLLALADDELVIGHRHSHWTGVAPSLEEDLAFSTIAQDEMNHADVWYSLIVSARDPEGTADARRAVDELGLGRAPGEYRHAVLCERPPRDFAYTLARHWAYDHADAIRLGVLADSSDGEIAAVAAKLLHEERYHLEHADHWFRRLAHGGEEAAGQLAEGLRAALPEALWLFEPLPEEDQLLADGVLPSYSAAMMVRWLEVVVPALEAVDLAGVLPAELEVSGTARAASQTASRPDWVLPDDHFAERGGRYGDHTADFTEDVWPEMTHLHRAHPGASW